MIELDTQNEVNNKNELNENKSTQNENSAGLDLDEIHNMNIMNGIIHNMNVVNKSLDNIIYNQNRIIELMSKQSFSEGLSKQSSSQMKLGRFKVEKYKPNMSITEFKKLFNTQP